MKNLFIEWKHYDKKGNTCVRCSKTGISLKKAIKSLRNKLWKKGIRISFKETKLSEEEIQASNTILLNGILIEDILGDIKTIETPCNSCCEMIGSSVSCRALDCQGQIAEEISVDLIKKAVKKFLSRKGTQ